MSINISGIDETLYFVANSVVNISQFFLFVLAPLILCVIIVVALVLATELNLKIRVLLINLFAVDITNWLAYAMLYLLFPVRVVLTEDTEICRIAYSFIFIAATQRYPSANLFAINIFCFVKYGKHKMKWFVIIPWIVVSWVIALLLVIVPYTFVERNGTVNQNGFCNTNSSHALFIAFTLLTLFQSLVHLGFVIAFCILTSIYIKKNVLEDSADIKKAVTKLLAHICIVCAVSLFYSVVAPLVPIIREAIKDGGLVAELAIIYIVRVIFYSPFIALPFVSAALLKPVKIAMKQMMGKVFCSCFPSNSVSPANLNRPADNRASAAITASPAIEMK